MSLQSRYDTLIEQKQLPNGRLVYRSLLPKTVTADIMTDSEVQADDTVRMDRLAANAYGDPLQWWKIAAVNKRFQGSMYFKPGSTIIVPAE